MKNDINSNQRQNNSQKCQKQTSRNEMAYNEAIFNLIAFIGMREQFFVWSSSAWFSKPNRIGKLQQQS